MPASPGMVIFCDIFFPGSMANVLLSVTGVATERISIAVSVHGTFTSSGGRQSYGAFAGFVAHGYAEGIVLSPALSDDALCLFGPVTVIPSEHCMETSTRPTPFSVANTVAGTDLSLRPRAYHARQGTENHYRLAHGHALRGVAVGLTNLRPPP